MSILTVLLLSSATTSCALPFRAVPDEPAAKAIAEVVIRAAPASPGPNAPYTIKIDYIPDRDEWMVSELPKTRMTGGGGLWFWISACDGKVYGVTRQV